MDYCSKKEFLVYENGKIIAEEWIDAQGEYWHKWRRNSSIDSKEHPWKGRADWQGKHPEWVYKEIETNKENQ